MQKEKVMILGKDDVLDMARLVLSQCDGAMTKDGKGYDVFDRFTVRDMLMPDIFGNEGLSDEEIEYLRGKLLRYKGQIRKFGLAYGYSESQIEKALKKLDEPICKNSIYIKGRADGTEYGRISYNWLKDKLGTTEEE